MDAQPAAATPVAPPPAPPDMKAGLQSVNAVPSKGSLSQEFSDLGKQVSASQAATKTELAGITPQPVPTETYKPLPAKESSDLFAMLMVIGALSGRTTHQPAVAAMNNMTGIMKGQIDKNDKMVAAQKDEFNTNFKQAMEKHKAYIDEKNAALESSKYDMQAFKEKGDFLKLKYGITDSVWKENAMTTYHDQQLYDKMLAYHTRLQAAGIMVSGAQERNVETNMTRIESERSKELEKHSDPVKQAEINARFDAQEEKLLAMPNKGAATPPAGKPTPTAEDIAYAKANPATMPAFIAHFGREP